MYPRSPHEVKMDPFPTNPPGTLQMVENVGMGAANPGPGWAEFVRLEQQLVGENARVLQAMMEQVVNTQNQASLKLWEVMTQNLKPRERYAVCAGDLRPAPPIPRI